MFKFISLLTIALLFCITVNAQTKFDVLIGVNISNTYVTENNTDNKLLSSNPGIGYNVGLLRKVNLSKKSNFKYGIVFKRIVSKTINTKAIKDFISIPFLINYDVFSSKFRIEGGFVPLVALKYSVDGIKYPISFFSDEHTFRMLNAEYQIGVIYQTNFISGGLNFSNMILNQHHSNDTVNTKSYTISLNFSYNI
ncbi:hypothetical protein [Flammeovirga kamogawensis]|uniref:PorT family protein n=1 Tax=Flammeovirga kamogawensis TaxID=373891 RepID=A0ABX8H211_9BACT|nr:hypothetical protein [Flammeovirga kamogawensis]MBB6462248.1 hypothetical protein [Flammeovirga kamogawensis]QWG09352.1 hypothetical protein KM029_22360 [Flammeovirga kamogawensis]TRX64874.1 hypothetical protein EO216_20275 [Flammeovirga kamogawensis]